MIPTAPKYVQVRDMLLREIMSGRLLDGERLPPERDMAEELGLAVGTLRKALDALADMGHLTRKHGSGNYIKAGSDVSGLYEFFRLERLNGGGVPTARVLDAKVLEKPVHLPRLSEAKTALRIRRLRLLDDIPAALEEIWLDTSAGHLTAQDLQDSLYATYRETLGLWIARAEDRVGIATTPDWGQDAPHAGKPCGYVERVSWDQHGARAEASFTWFDADQARYVQRIK